MTGTEVRVGSLDRSCTSAPHPGAVTAAHLLSVTSHFDFCPGRASRWSAATASARRPSSKEIVVGHQRVDAGEVRPPSILTAGHPPQDLTDEVNDTVLPIDGCR